MPGSSAGQLPEVPRKHDTAAEERLRRAIMQRIKLRHLRIFIEVARQESISRAAVVLNIAQPAVTKSLHDLENQLEVSLFERRARGVVLNDAGRLILPFAHAVVCDFDRIADQVISFNSGRAGTITVGATMAALPYLLPQCLANPKIHGAGALIRVVEGTIEQMQRALSRGEVDLVIGRVLRIHPPDLFEAEVIHVDPFVPVVSAAHPLAGLGRKALDRLSEYEWIMPPYGSSAAAPLERYMMHNNIQPKRQVIETLSVQTILGLLECTDCVAILPRHVANYRQRLGTHSIVGPELEENSLPIGITHRHDRPLSPRALVLAEVLREVIATMEA